MKNSVICALLVLLMVFPAIGYAQEPADETQWKTRISDLADARIGVVTGGLQALYLPQMLPDAEFVEFNMTTDAAMALSLGKIDSFSAEESTYLAMRREGQPFARLDEPFMVSEYGVLFSKSADPKLLEQFNAFLAEGFENGTLTALQQKWFGGEEPTELMTMDHLTGENGTIRYVSCSTVKPYAFIKNGQFTGFDTEMMILFAEKYGYQLKITDASFSGLLTGIEQGKYDMAAGGVTITEERRKSILFSAPYYAEDVVMIVLEDTLAGSAAARLEDFAAATLGVIDGSLYDGISRRLFPQAEIQSYPSFSDLFQCLRQGKIDGFLLDTPNLSAAQRTDAKLKAIPVPGEAVEIGIAFGKDENGLRLTAEMNAFLDELRINGEFDILWAYWCADTEPAAVPALPDVSGNPTKLHISVDLARKPFAYMLGSEYAGFEIELLYRFCDRYGYAPVFEVANWTSGVAGLKTGKYDVVSCGIYITEERKESVSFCEPYAVADVVMVTYETPSAARDTWASLAESFEKTFLREDRWKLIAEGLGNTVLISGCAVLGGTVFGFGLYMLARSSFRAVAAVTRGIVRVYARLIAGTPTLVVLMILFYIIFGKADINGLWVAVLGFALTFGSFVYSHLSLCVAGIDRGQTEASYALGYTRNQTFFRIILPQSMKNFLPTYTGEVVGLIKSTSVVGYIAVCDLTKMGDIIRSSTYEAVFPLLAVAVIYFIITWGAAALLGLVQRKLDNHKRKNKNILKGVAR